MAMECAYIYIYIYMNMYIYIYIYIYLGTGGWHCEATPSHRPVTPATSNRHKRENTARLGLQPCDKCSLAGKVHFGVCASTGCRRLLDGPRESCRGKVHFRNRSPAHPRYVQKVCRGNPVKENSRAKVSGQS